MKPPDQSAESIGLIKHLDLDRGNLISELNIGSIEHLGCGELLETMKRPDQ